VFTSDPCKNNQKQKRKNMTLSSTYSCRCISDICIYLENSYMRVVLLWSASRFNNSGTEVVSCWWWSLSGCCGRKQIQVVNGDNCFWTGDNFFDVHWWQPLRQQILWLKLHNPSIVCTLYLIMQYFLNEKSIAVSMLYFSLFLLYDEVAFSCRWSGTLLSQVKLFMNSICSRYFCALVLA
jgi:hypothetical protein